MRFSRFLQPLFKLLQCDLPALALRFFLSGFFTPGVELVLGDPARPDPGKTLLVLPAVNFEYLPLFSACGLRCRLTSS